MCDPILERVKHLHPKVIDLALDRIETLLAALGHPEDRLPPVVHVAGTNGKGSTVAFLRAILEAAGRTVHAYISPHLVHFAERIRVAGRIIDGDGLTGVLTECERLNAGRAITFFEITTAAALLAFSRQRADVCLLETGLGGRYDATNVVARPALTLLTPLSLDHQAYLGETLAAIAGEKAGIIKRGTPCLSSRQEPEALAAIVSRADELGTPLLVEGRDWSVEPTHDGLRFSMGDADLLLPAPGLPGPHQVHNAGLAIAAAHMLPGALGQGPQAAVAIADGLQRVEWPARLQRLTRGPLVDLLPDRWEMWLDGGHNPAAGRALSLHIEERWGGRPVDLIVGMLNTKDVRGFLGPLVDRVRRLRAVTIPGEANSLLAEQVADAASALGIPAAPADDLASAVRDLAQDDGSARLLICGSLYLAGVVLRDNGS